LHCFVCLSSLILDQKQKDKEEERLKWYTVRGALTGFHWEEWDKTKAYELAWECYCYEALSLLHRLYFPQGPNGTQNTLEEVMATLSRWNICHVVPHFAPDEKTERLFQNNDHYYSSDIEEEVHKIGELAVAATDPLTVCAVARWYLFFKHVPKALTLFHMAANWGDRVAQFYYGLLAFGPDDIMRFVWWGKALQRRLHSEHVLTHRLFDAISAHLSSVPVPDNILFEIGRAVEIHMIDVPKRHKLLFREANMFYKRCCVKAEEAIQCWLNLTKRLLVKDVQNLIANMAQSDKSAWGRAARERTTTRTSKKVRCHGQQE
jgi:hypothetical protein